MIPPLQRSPILADEQRDTVIVVFQRCVPVPDGAGGGAEFPLIPHSVSRVPRRQQSDGRPYAARLNTGKPQGVLISDAQLMAEVLGEDL